MRTVRRPSPGTLIGLGFVQGLYKNRAFPAHLAYLAQPRISNLQILKDYGANNSVSGHHNLQCFMRVPEVSGKIASRRYWEGYEALHVRGIRCHGFFYDAQLVGAGASGY